MNNMKVDEVIEFLEEATNHTYDTNEKYHIHECIEALWHMKICNCFKNQ